MIRWRYVLTRLILVVAVLMILALGLGPMVNYITVTGLQASTGAKAEIGAANVSLFPPSIRYTDVRIADPRDGKDFRDSFAADSVELVIDGDAFLRRRWVVSQGKITGLQIGSARETSGHLERDVQVVEKDSGPSFIERMLSDATDGLADQAETLGKNLETVKTGDDIRRKWKSEYETLVRRAKDLEDRVRLIRDEAKGIDNPLRDWPRLEKTLQEARTAREELILVRNSMEQYPDQMRADLVRLEQARQADLAKIDAYVPGDLNQSKNFGIDLVAAQVRDSVTRLRDYLDNGRKLANYTIVAPDVQRTRGEDIDFLGPRRRPEMLIRQCQISGMMRAEGKAYTVTGLVENMTPQPEYLDTPTRAKLLLEGPETVQVDYIRDRRQGEALDRLTLHWPKMHADSIRLGDRERFAIAIAGGQREVWVQLNSRGDQVDGRLVSKQVGVNMHLDASGQFANSPAMLSVNQSLAAVDTVDVDASFQGQWRDLKLALKTNLTDVFHEAMTVAVTRQVEASKEKLAAKVQDAHREQRFQLQEFMSKQQNEAQNLLASADRSIEEMSQKVLAEVGDADSYLGKLRTAFGKSLR